MFQLKAFLKKHVVSKTSTTPRNFGSYGSIFANYHVPDAEIDTLCELIANCDFNSTAFSIQEVYNSTDPHKFHFDYDIKKPIPTNDETENPIEITIDEITLAQTIVAKFFEITNISTETPFFYGIRKHIDRPKNGKGDPYIHFGIHIIINYNTDTNSNRMIANQMKETFAGIDTDIYKGSTNAWVINPTGSKVNTNKQFVKPYVMFDRNDNEVGVNADDIKRMLLQDKYSVDPLQTFTLPLDNNDIEISEALTTIEKKGKGSVKAKSLVDRASGGFKTITSEQLRGLLNELPADFCEDRRKWLSAISVCKHSGCVNAREICMEWSKQSSKFSEDDFDLANPQSLWNTYKIHLPLYYLMKHSTYRIIDNVVNTITADDMTERTFALQYYNEHKEHYIRINMSTYHYNGIYWEKLNDEEALRVKLITYCSELVDSLYTNTVTAYTHETDENQKFAIKAQLPIIKRQRNKVNTLQFGKNVVGIFNGLISRVVEDPFWEREKELFFFNNCIVDLRTGETVDPDPKYKHYLTTGYDYIEPTRDNIDDMFKIINSIFPDVEIRDYYLKTLCFGLNGILSQKFQLLTGNGGNGKGVITRYINSMLGNYFYAIDINVLQSGHKSGGTQPELAQMNNKRYIDTSEPSTNKDFSASMIKRTTGEEVVKARNLFSNDMIVHMQGHICCQVNSPPVMDEITDDAIRRRMLITPFKVSFVDNPNPNNPFQQKSDKSIDSTEKRIELRCAFFKILISYYKQLIEEAYEPIKPPSIQHLIDDYLASNAFKEFIDETFERTTHEQLIAENQLEINTMSSVMSEFKHNNHYTELSKEQQHKYRAKFMTTFMKNNYEVVEGQYRIRGKPVRNLICLKRLPQDNDLDNVDIGNDIPDTFVADIPNAIIANDDIPNTVIADDDIPNTIIANDDDDYIQDAVDCLPDDVYLNF